MRILIFFITFSISVGWSFAQDNCAELLSKAQSAFELGKIEEIPALINPCIKNEFNKEQKGIAYKLLAITYLYDKDEPMADEAMLNLLRVNPLFKPNYSNDPSEFISLYNSFRTHPILKAGISIGSSLFSVRDVNRFGVENLQTEKEHYTGGWGIEVGLDVEIPLGKRLSAYTALHYSTKTYSSENSLLSFNELRVNESQNWADVYLMAQYYFNERSVRPFLRAGGYGGYLIAVQANYYTRQDNLNDIEGPAENIKTLRRSYNYGVAGDLGVSYAFGRSIVDVAVRFTYALANYSQEENRNGSLGNKLALTYGYQDNDFYANILGVTAGYKLMIFKPKKLR